MSSSDRDTHFLDVPIVEEKEYDYDDMDEVVDDRYNPEDKTLPITVIIPKLFKSKQRDNKLAKLDMNELFSLFYDPDLSTQKPKTSQNQKD
ncbi:MAG: hypothetical protein HZA82_04210 [Thaumarchaeota archaeon]|nr:hypothetical protein [Nitrososphaerota archaeon]